LALDRGLVKALNALACVESVSIIALGPGVKTQCNMALIPRANFAALSSLCNHPRVTKLSFQDCTNLPLCLFAERHLKTLELDNAHFQASETPVRAGDADEVTLSYIPDVVPFSYPPAKYMERVTDLSFYPPLDANTSDARTVLHAVSKSLRTLWLTFLNYPPPDALDANPPFDLGALPRLSCLSLCFTPSIGDIDSFREVLDALATWLHPADGRASQLTTLKIRIDVTSDSVEPDARELVALDPTQTILWGRLEHVLADARLYPALQTVEFAVLFAPHPLTGIGQEDITPQMKEGRDIWRACLDSASAQGVFSLLAAKGIEAAPTFMLSPLVFRDP